MRQLNRFIPRVRRAASPEVWALAVLILFAVILQARGPEGPQMQLLFASCGAGPEFQAGAPLEARLGEMTDRIDSRTERVWRRLELKMRHLEERMAKSPGSCSPTRGLRASMFEE